NRPRRTWRCRRNVDRDPGADSLRARARLRFPFRVPRLRVGAVVRHGVPDCDGGTAAQRPISVATGGQRAYGSGNADSRGVMTAQNSVHVPKLEVFADRPGNYFEKTRATRFSHPSANVR